MTDETYDPFFHLTADTEWNACIGPQGNEFNYIDGYMEAAVLLATTLLREEMHVNRDTLAMPILYNARHAIELLLKFVVSHLAQAKVLGHAPALNHDIAEYHQKLSDSHVGDRALRGFIAELDPYVTSLAAIDSDGQELRYVKNRDGGGSLAGRPLVNLELVKHSLDKLKVLLEAMRYRTIEFAEELGTKSHTPQCSRKDLLEIAKLLPPKTEWGTPEFSTAKDNIKTLYGLISNRQCIAALEIIKGNREMGGLIGLEFPLVYLTDEQVVQIVEHWSLRHPARANTSSGIDFFSRSDREAMMQSLSRDATINARLRELLNAEAIADLDAIFYTGRERLYSEWYETNVARALREHDLERDDSNALEHLISKTNLFKCLVRGLTILGRRELAENIRKLRPDLSCFE